MKIKEFKEKYRLFEEAFEIEEPWDVVRYEIDYQTGVLDIYLDFPRGSTFVCPHCGHGQARVHDVVNVDRTWRHLDFWQYKDVSSCPTPTRTLRSLSFYSNRCCRLVTTWWWFTLLFESELLGLMKEMPMAAVARKVGEHDTRLWRVFHYYVNKHVDVMDLSGVTRTSLRSPLCRC
ncbi:helix-turn-helix domain-containing protein [Shouchella shacheensis]|uniref:helix-turn-helix domain-containing protein n=1 Tax=Shouchella shacheensis TaxID=1649580 RepID=UPI00073FD85F|nr:helix-turn-helix domain-containing protein [Shouchella shacheensis]